MARGMTSRTDCVHGIGTAWTLQQGSWQLYSSWGFGGGRSPAPKPPPPHKPTVKRQPSMLSMRKNMHRRITDLAYRLRPEQPPEGLQYISISSEAKHLF